MVVMYVDDCGVSAPTQDIIDDFIKQLRDMNLELTQESTFAEFLGIKFETLNNGKIQCTHTTILGKIQ